MMIVPPTSEFVMVQVALSPLPKATEPAVAVPTTVPAVPAQPQVPSLYPDTAFSSSVLVPALTPVSAVLVYVVVLPTVAPAPNDRVPALVARPKSPTTFVPPWLLTTFLTIVKDAA